MKLTSDNETLAEKKALILYILDKVSKPISNDALLKLAISIDNMNYFYFQQFLLVVSISSKKTYEITRLTEPTVTLSPGFFV